MINYNMIYSQNPRSIIGTPNTVRGLKSPLMPIIQMTPKTKALYAFGESASGDLEKLPDLWNN